MRPSAKATNAGISPIRIPRINWARPPTSAPGLGSSLPHLHRDWARPSHICTRTGLTPATYICTGTRLTPATSAPGLGSPLPHPPRDWPSQPMRNPARHSVGRVHTLTGAPQYTPPPNREPTAAHARPSRSSLAAGWRGRVCVCVGVCVCAWVCVLCVCVCVITCV